MTALQLHPTTTSSAEFNSNNSSNWTHPESSLVDSDYLFNEEGSTTSSDSDPDSAFKDGHRRRQYLAQKSWDRATKSYLAKKFQHNLASVSGRHAQKQGQAKGQDNKGRSGRRREQENSDNKTEEEGDAIESTRPRGRQLLPQELQREKKIRQKIEERQRRRMGEDSNDNKSTQPKADDQDSEEDDSNDENEEVAAATRALALDVAHEEKIRFKHNLGFKTVDHRRQALGYSDASNKHLQQSSLDARQWKQIVEKRLDQQDKARVERRQRQ